MLKLFKMKKLSEISTKPPLDYSKKAIKDEFEELQKRLADLQKMMYAQAKYSILVVLQGMDASGKDGLVEDVFAQVPAYGIALKAFKVPTKEELAHDFLWRIHKEMPAKGQIKIFNRSHYEDVLVTRVLGYVNDELAQKRFQQINHFEELVAQNDTIILKFFLHTSYQEQGERLEERMTNPEKYWKHSDTDWEMRKHWDKFMVYYQEVINKCSTPFEWHIIPSDENNYKEILVLRKIVETLEKLPLSFPPLVTEMEK